MLSRMMTRREQMVLIIFAVSIFIGAGTLLLQQDEPVPMLPTPESLPTAPATSPATSTPPLSPRAADVPPEAPAPIGVAIMGAVQHPGLYYVSADTRVGELLAQAGGALPGTDLDAFDLAAPLLDGTTLSIPGARTIPKDTLIPYQHWGKVSHNPVAYLNARHQQLPTAVDRDRETEPLIAPANTQISINTASQTTLETLPGIGPALAQRIMAYRAEAPFRSLEELQEVTGIGPARYQALLGKIRL